MADILVVDDERPMRELLRTALRLDGHIVVVACDVAEAREAIKGKAFDLVITDINMSGATGWDLLQWIRANTSSVSVVLMSGALVNQVEQSAVMLGAAAGLQKPFGIKLLRDTVTRILSEKGQMESEPAVAGTHPKKENARFFVSLEVEGEPDNTQGHR